MDRSFTTTFNVAYCIMLIPSQIILTYVRPSFWLPGLEILWGFLTGLMAMTTSAKQVYVLRVFLGLCESSAWPGMITLFSTFLSLFLHNWCGSKGLMQLVHWYTPTELAKRMGFYHSCQAVGQMLSGALQAAITKTLNNQAGMAGWRWLFVINAIITVVWGFAGFIMIPDLPNKPNPRALWFDKTIDAELSMHRLSRNGRAEPKRMSWAAVKRTFSGWVVYFITILYCASVLGTYGYNYFSLFLEWVRKPDGTRRWSTAQVNAVPIAGSAINVVFVWFWALLSDLLHTRYTLIITQCMIALIPCIIMSLWTKHPTTLPLSAAYASYFLSYVPLGTTPLIFAWLSDLIPQDPESRALIVGVAVAGYYAISAWSQVLVWPAAEAPVYKVGWESAAGLVGVVVVMTGVLRWVDGRYLEGKRVAFRVVNGVEVGEDGQGKGKIKTQTTVRRSE